MITNEIYDLENETGSNREGSNANAPLERLTATSVIGDKVVNAEGEELGTIKDIMINIRNGTVEYIVLQYNGFFGFGEKLFAVPFSDFSIDAEEKEFVLDRSVEELKSNPGFDKEHWPGTNNQQHNYFNSFEQDYPSSSAGFSGL